MRIYLYSMQRYRRQRWNDWSCYYRHCWNCCPNIDVSSIESMLDLEKKCGRFPMVGLYWLLFSHDWEEQLHHIKTYLDKGLLLQLVKSELIYTGILLFQKNRRKFSEFSGWAKSLNLPIVIHTRNSFRKFFRTGRSKWRTTVKGVSHCFHRIWWRYRAYQKLWRFYLWNRRFLTFLKIRTGWSCSRNFIAGRNHPGRQIHLISSPPLIAEKKWKFLIFRWCR